MGSAAGVSDAKLDAVADRLYPYSTSPLFTERERIALAYADAITLSDLDVDDELFGQVRQHFNDDELVELTATIAWENFSSKFNRAFRVPSHDLWKRR